MPEILIAGRKRAYPGWFLRRKTANPETFSDADIDEYLRVFVKDSDLLAGLGYCRAANLPARQNRASSARGKLRMPVLALGPTKAPSPTWRPHSWRPPKMCGAR
ncbi:hypothetical protein [uncultured Sphingomonas sp.]|uniref:hypothetical protein n=1 Tax=uncultured Sphingomonas sp. TaxID=158754 RepID=UPI0035C96D31